MGEGKRVVVIEPGDTLFIANLAPVVSGFDDYNEFEMNLGELADTLKKFGFEQVLFFGQDITISSDREEKLAQQPATGEKVKGTCAHCGTTENLGSCGKCSEYWCPASFYTKALHPCARK